MTAVWPLSISAKAPFGRAVLDRATVLQGSSRAALAGLAVLAMASVPVTPGLAQAYQQDENSQEQYGQEDGQEGIAQDPYARTFESQPAVGQSGPTNGFANGFNDGLNDDSVPATAAVLRGLDKVTANVRQFVVPAGSVLDFGRLSIRVQTCRSTPPTAQTPESSVFLEIDDRRSDGSVERVFSGWMFASSPALNPLNHPVYDVWVMSCRTLSPEGDSSNR